MRDTRNSNPLTNFIYVRLNRKAGELDIIPRNPGRYYTDVIAENLLGLSSPKKLEITVILPGYVTWQKLFWTSPDLENPAISGWEADPDMDGLANGLEYLMRLNPTVPDAGPIPSFHQEGNEMVFNYQVDTTITDAVLKAQVSTDLALTLPPGTPPPDESWADVTPTILGEANGLRDLEVRLPIADERLFFRLKAVKLSQP